MHSKNIVKENVFSLRERGAGGRGGGGEIMGIRYLGCGKVTTKEKVVGIYFVTIASIIM